MKDKSLISYAIIFTLCASILFPSKTIADWAYAFVVWDGYVYVITDEIVNEVEKEIGHVTRYSDREGTYSGNFSNVYPKGTKYYSIVELSTDEAIAIKDEKGKYIKATRDGEYSRNMYDILQTSSSTIILWTLIMLLIAIMGIYFISKRRN
ncbi:hypothetical protein [Psychrobacillus sp. L4]|uniref:hypothetical protein n=1 Tax=Psychrobacillus sp. L4 TaxID=3236892 RepID=UPI0036F44C31